MILLCWQYLFVNKMFVEQALAFLERAKLEDVPNWDKPDVIAQKFAKNTFKKSQETHRGKRTSDAKKNARKESNSKEEIIKLVASELLLTQISPQELVSQNWLKKADNHFIYKLREQITKHFHWKLTVQERERFAKVSKKMFMEHGLTRTLEIKKAIASGVDATHAATTSKA